MVKIYTKKGDDGSTSLWYGGRVPKHHDRTEAYGSLDEACSHLGVARALCNAAEAELAADILRLQNDLFVAGAELATETVIHFVNRASDYAYAMARFADVDEPALFEGRRKS